MRSWKRGWRGLKDTEAACVFGLGYLANAGIIPVLVGQNDLLLVTRFRIPVCGLARNCRVHARTHSAHDIDHAAELLATIAPRTATR